MRSVFSTVAVMLVLCMACSFACAQEEEDPPFSTGDTDVGYIDSALPMSQIRFRFDSAFDNPLPDRAEFFYRGAISPDGNLYRRQTAETGVDYRDIWVTAEYAFNPRVSVFLDTAYRFLDPEQNEETDGFGDLQFGLKRVLWSRSVDMLSVQLRTYLPTGNAEERLGTDHVSLEPGLLYLARLNPRTRLEGELKLWIPLDPSLTPDGQEFAGEVMRYGVGIGHDLLPSTATSPRVTAVTEVVGWTILDGFATVADPSRFQRVGLKSAAGDTIVNLKIGLRCTNGRHSAYVGYGRGLTGHVWYQDVIRAEYAIRF